jgi:hypothetical protein
LKAEAEFLDLIGTGLYNKPQRNCTFINSASGLFAFEPMRNISEVSLLLKHLFIYFL